MAVHHRVMDQAGIRERTRFGDQDLGGVIILVVESTEGPAQTFLFDLAAEFHLIILEKRRPLPEAENWRAGGEGARIVHFAGIVDAAGVFQNGSAPTAPAGMEILMEGDGRAGTNDLAHG